MQFTETSMSILTPSEGYVLYNGEALASGKVYCPVGQESPWYEITEAEAAEIEAQMKAEAEEEEAQMEAEQNANSESEDE